ncbi:hypothetical protein SUGI_0691410 [Cryptomeria japonica]|uniref:uncharacterized protein LOC131047220 n=1 Tax=Cryptomeria japonica TaxID=3369 RepID=UPI0024148EFB|nr:uncharacterized protein LOC131047220 [Cryptomeria japonica]GLJ34389.1 hypothetical protein SUGI_0691410 [Cryptomeria japonica]
MSDLATSGMAEMKEKSPLPMYSEEGETSTSAGILSLHIQNEGEGMNASAVVETLSPNLFRVMRIVSDKQDYSFVEKVQLPHTEVLSLCNKLVPSSASAYLGEPPRISINFNSLNQQCLPAVGFYGDKTMITRIFRKESLVDGCVLAEMEGRLLEPGLYVSLPEEGCTVVVFYWHEGEHFKQASRKDASCNFIRYLVELCDSVYVCMEGSYPFQALAASATSASSKAKRTRRIQVSSVKNSENDVELFPGYSLRIDGGANGRKFSAGATANVAAVNNYYRTVVFCEGYQHCCFLTTEKRSPRTSKKQEELSMKASEFANTLKTWSSACNVDYSRLSNEQFINLLECCQPQELEKHSKLKESLKMRESARSFAQVEDFERCFLQVLPEFCNHVLLFLGGRTSTANDLDGHTNLENTKELYSCSDMEVDGNKFDEMHRELSMILAGEDAVCNGDQRVLLLGSEIKFIRSDWEHMITVEGPSQGKDTSPFIRYGQEVDAKCSPQCPCSRKISGKAKFLQPVNEHKDLPFSGDKVKFLLSIPAKSGNNDKKEIEGTVYLVNKTASFSAIRSWVENMVPIELRSLERNIVFTSFLLGSHQSLALTFMEEHLTTQNKRSLPRNIQSEFEKFSNAQPARPTVDQEALLSHDTLKKVCCQVYKDQERKFKENIKELSALVFKKKKVNLGKAEQRRSREAEDEFLQEYKKKMSTVNNDNLVTRYIEEVRTTKPSWYSYSRQVELKVKLSIEEEHPFAIVYKVCELIPMRKDISEFNSNCGRPIIPTYGESVELATINPQHERLFKVVILKSGELMVFLHNFTDPSLSLYRYPKVGFNNMGPPIHTFRRGFDLLAVDEATRSMALYEKERSKTVIYKFDESFRKVYWTGVEVNLESYKGSKIITWMHLIPGKMELLLVDDTNKARVAEIHERPMMRAKHISLPSQPHSLRACVSVDGYFFIVFRQLQRQGEDFDIKGARHASPENMLDIYVLGDTMSYLKTIPLNARECSISDLEQLEAKFTVFGSQSQLLLYSLVDAPDCILSHVLKTALAREVVQLQQVDRIKAPEDETEITGSCPYLGYIYHIFDKFAITPKLFPDAKKCIAFKVVLESSRSVNCNGEGCVTYLEALVRQLKAGKDKDFSGMKIQFEVNNVENCSISAVAEQQKHVKMGMWVRKLVSLVPIQIARAENNAMVALKDGLQIPPDVSYVDSISLAYSIRFGFYDAVLSSWKGKIKVISSMGKQSSGKSYLLNHLSGSLLDVAGGRCTDGVWMTIATGEDGDGSEGSSCLYVLLDFEGLGSFERSEQEDMLLSVLNAAVSNITIFNKKDFHLDKDTEAAFSRFQSGINLLKQDRKLFKGLFYIAIKDVDTSDVEDLMQEFHQKISQICSKSQENFILKMYDGKVEIAAMAPYNRSEYYRESLSELAETVAERIDSCYASGITFMRDLKLIIAQIAAKDWTSIDSKRVAVTVDILRRNLMSAVHVGCLSVTNANEELRVLDNFDTQEEVLDFPVVVGDSSWNIRDSGLYLSPCTESETPLTIRDIFSEVGSKLEMVLPRNGSNGEDWHSSFERFLEALADRRHARVQQWISSNTTDFSDNDEVQRLQLEADVALGKVKQGLIVCGCKCSVCFWRCVMEKGHGDQHSCMGSHSCTENCSYCAREGDSLNLCGDLAGHEGNHNCKKKNHTCGESCYLYGTSSNCNDRCSLGPGHPGQHKCNSPQHMCSAKCSLPSCNNPCAVAIESNHETHQCHERYCQSKCMIDECSRTCGVKDHFHDLDQNAEHLCGNEHACSHECEMPGICEIFTELVKQTRVFQGQRGSFEYELVSEQNGLRKCCCIPIPPYERNHQGPHVHTKKEDSVHYCDTRCQSCGYFCQLPIDHSSLHDTVHGNMRNATFISEGEDIDIQDRKYKWGELGEAEMCNMYCKKQGRGHIHLVPCKGSEMCTSNLYDGARHETVKYGPDVHVPKDEMTHETYWQYVRFVDPCTQEEREDFDRCNHYCKSEEHEAEAGGASDKSYCTEKLWHAPIKSSGQNLSSAGYITDDGHHFGCDHSKNVPHHAIFIIDRSGSMDSSDIMPTMAKFNNHSCRLGCVYESILRFIQARLRTVSDDSVSVVLFDTSASVPLEMEDLEEGVVDRLLPYYPGGGTTYSSGLDAAEKILMKGAGHHLVDVKKPVVIFLSDGGNNGGGDPLYYVDKMKRADPRMILHTIMFGRDPTMNLLIEMAKKGGGTFDQTLDEIQLARSFENLAESFKPQVAALM